MKLTLDSLETLLQSIGMIVVVCSVIYFIFQMVMILGQKVMNLVHKFKIDIKK